jgi:hypothetical protein
VGFDQGGLLTDAINKHPYAVVLLDEIEKAHPELFNILLQVMDHATLTDNNGKKADFRNVVLIMTTNAGAREMSEKVVGFGAKQAPPTTSKGKAALERRSPPSSATASTPWCSLGQLSAEVILQVVDKEVKALQSLLDDKKVTLEVSPRRAAGWASAATTPPFGDGPRPRMARSRREGGVARATVKDDQEARGSRRVSPSLPPSARGVSARRARRGHRQRGRAVAPRTGGRDPLVGRDTRLAWRPPGVGAAGSVARAVGFAVRQDARGRRRRSRSRLSTPRTLHGPGRGA